jgi:UDP-N-acetylglucosamine 2-epimerase (non-hydrolysing)
LLAELLDALAQPKQDRKRPEYWDGKTAQRCVEDLRRRTVTCSLAP